MPWDNDNITIGISTKGSILPDHLIKAVHDIIAKLYEPQKHQTPYRIYILLK
jgi:hypothetical protein